MLPKHAYDNLSAGNHWFALSAASVASVLFSAAALAAPQPAAKGQPAVPYESRLIMNTNIDMALSDDVYVARAISDMRELGFAAVRESMGGMPPSFEGAHDDWTLWDKRIAQLDAAGLRYIIPLIPEHFVRNDDDFGPKWSANFVHWVTEVVSRYGDRALWFSLCNEPDFKKGWWGDPDNVVRVQKLAYETIKKINPNARLETSPVGVPALKSGLAKELLTRGITRYCDYFGFHTHFADDADEAKQKVYEVWLAMREGVAKGFPVRPIVCTENGSYWSRYSGKGEGALNVEQQHQWRAWYMAQDLVMMKNYGVSYIVAYSWALSRPQGAQYNFVDAKDDFKRAQPEWDTLKAVWNPQAHFLSRGLNSGFEESNDDKSRGWVVPFRLLQNENATEVKFPPREWSRVNFVHDAKRARTGEHFLQMSAGGKNRVRRLVEGLEPARRYRVSAFVRVGQEADCTAALAAMGFEPLDGLARQEQAAARQASWQSLQVEFTAVNPWVVINLEHNGVGTADWDDVKLEAL